MAELEFAKQSFFSKFIKPILLVLCIPVLSYAFYTYAVYDYDSGFRSDFLQYIKTEEAKKNYSNVTKLKHTLENIKISEILKNDLPEDREIIKTIPSSDRFNYYVFDWALTISLFSAVIIVLSLLLVLSIIYFTSKNQEALYKGFNSSFHLLKIVCLVEVLCQGALLFSLSFYVTAVFFNVYFVKIILVIGILIVCGMGAFVIAIFKRPDTAIHVRGKLISKEMAPEIWARITEICQTFSIPIPDHFILGIDDNFFVTENEVFLNEEKLCGKTLYGSIPLIRMLSKSETKAILAHEMAHFSGSDTVFTTKLSPILQKYYFYLNGLYAGVNAPIFYFMYFFWNLFQLKINKMKREREYRADAKSSEITSPKDSGYALLKLSAFSMLRNHIEKDLFDKNERLRNLNIKGNIATSFNSYVNSDTLTNDLDEFNTTHPFDTHPSLKQRFENLKLEIKPYQIKSIILEQPADTFLDSINNIDEIEIKLWKEFEEQFNAAHEMRMSYHIDPKTMDEKDIVKKHFPDRCIVSKNNKVTFRISYEKAHLDSWESEIYFDSIKSLELQDEFILPTLVITYVDRFTNKKRKAKLKNSGFPKDTKVIDIFKYYYGRHLTMVEAKAEKPLT